MTKYPSLPQTIQDITFGGEWTRTTQGDAMLLADSGENDTERIIMFATKKIWRYYVTLTVLISMEHSNLVQIYFINSLHCMLSSRGNNSRL